MSDDHTSTQVVDTEEIDVIDLVSPVSSPQEIPLPSLPPLPPPPMLPSPNSLPKPPPTEPEPEPEPKVFSSLILQPNVECSRSNLYSERLVLRLDKPPPPPPPQAPVAPFTATQLELSRIGLPGPTLSNVNLNYDEPPPPGEESLLTVTPVGPMALGPDHEAEASFFRSQGDGSSNIEFSDSAWTLNNVNTEFVNCYQTSYEYTPPVPITDKRLPRRKRKNSRKNQISVGKRKKSEADNEDTMEVEEEESLRALLLAQVE